MASGDSITKARGLFIIKNRCIVGNLKNIRLYDPIEIHLKQIYLKRKLGRSKAL